ncbi:MAG: iron-containing alcohol dehydrogenase [Planctomycetes bacterium]|nr:iron-containing alcohol dehydrogenase [Planctomycetota bacterium]
MIDAPAFAFSLPVRIVYGAGSLARLSELCREHAMRRVLLVTDRGIVQAGHVARALDVLREADVSATCWDGVVENPTERSLDSVLAVAREAEIDGFVALGGGSSIDTAKGCNFLLTNGGRMGDYWGHGKATRPMLPLIAVPTTAGTGSEVQSFTLIAQDEGHQKMACGDEKAMPRVALLDPELTLTMPRSVTAITGLDTLTHAVETAVTKKRTAISALFAREAYRLVVTALPRVLDEPANLDARGAMLQAAAFAGIAIEQSMLGVAHSLANPLTAHYDVPHGHAVAVMLPHVVRFNGTEASALRGYGELCAAAGTSHGADPVAALDRELRTLLDACDVPSLRSHGVTESDLTMLAAEAAAQWTAQFNPRPVTAADCEHLYRDALHEGSRMRSRS